MVIFVNFFGFIGSKNLGNWVGVEVLLDYVVGMVEFEFIIFYDINLIGEYNIVGEMWVMLFLFEKVGIWVLLKIMGDVIYKEVCYVYCVKFNVMICFKVMINMVWKMEEEYGIFYIEELFYGVVDINNCFWNIVVKIGDVGL